MGSQSVLASIIFDYFDACGICNICTISWKMNSDNKLDGKAELEKTLAKYPKEPALIVPHDNSEVIDWSNLITYTDSNISFISHVETTITFESRDALLEALCQKAFGAKPIYKDLT